MTLEAFPFLAALPEAQEWLRSLIRQGALLTVAGRILAVLLILLGARLLIRLAESFAGRIFLQFPTEHFDERRAKTLSTLTASLARYGIYFFAGVMILQNLGFNTTSILTAAGIGGLAVGFGAQNLVRDVITGFFILLEDQFGVGDWITAGGVSGVVEAMGIRITKIRDFGGELHIVPNGQITQVTNHMGPSMRVMFDVQVSYDTDLDKALKVLQEVLDAYAKDNDRLVERPQALGVHEFTESGVNLLVLARTRPMEQWGVERELKQRIKERFDAEGIEMPYPHRLLVLRSGLPGEVRS
ncbi:MAG TPA: mechanosensitive ion channel family protein [Firmicutes bacterium]|nr:mechanosensitive ion channel family protein [Bacillota bacterium]